MTDSPLVSIVLPVQNNEKFLSSCLDSLLKQSYENIEIIAIDDKSKDNSLKILNSYRKQDNRIKVFKNVKKYGFPVCYNRAFKKVKGQFIAFMGAQDTCSPKRLRKQLEFLQSNSKTVAVGCQLVLTNLNNRKKGLISYPVDNESVSKNLIRGTAISFESMMINKFLLPKDLLYFKKQSHPFYFIEFFLSIFAYGEINNLPEYLYYQRQIENNLSTTNNLLLRLKIFIKSVFIYDFRPSIFSVLKPAR